MLRVVTRKQGFCYAAGGKAVFTSEGRSGIAAHGRTNGDFMVIVVILLNMGMFATIIADHRPNFKVVFAGIFNKAPESEVATVLAASRRC